ncbi:hypothetical protein V2J09_005980, partial [Rumex salicifolius]
IALDSLTKDWGNKPSTWQSVDPCTGWDGIRCESNRVTSIRWASMDLTGQLTGDLSSLTDLQYLDLSYNTGLKGVLPDLGKLKKLINLSLVGCSFSGPVPESIGSLPLLSLLALNSNGFIGNIPSSLGNLTELTYLDLSDNQISGTIPVSNGSMPGLDKLLKAKHFHFGINKLTGEIPETLFSSNMNLIHVLFDNNQFSGKIPESLGLVNTMEVIRFDNNSFTSAPANLNNLTNLQEMDMSNNSFNSSAPPEWFSTLTSLTTLLLQNPYCTENTGSTYCTAQQTKLTSYSTPFDNCTASQCSSGQTSSPKCKCAIPYTGTLVFRAPTFSNLGISSNYDDLEASIIKAFNSVNLPVNSVSLSNVTRDQYSYLRISLAVFPDGTKFNTTEISYLGFVLSNQILKTPSYFGPYIFFSDSSSSAAGDSPGKKKSVSTGLIAGIAVGVAVLLVLLICAGLYACRQKKRAEMATSKTDPFATWDKNKSFGDVPQLQGTHSFTFDELKRCTQDFADSNNIGAGGYGKVYKGVLANKKVVAIKRAQMGSMQGAVEFKNEIELLSRVHHKNLVNLIGFCYEQGEQMLVYEFMPNGTLMDNLRGKSKYNVDWITRMRIALGSARGLAYLHELADPPIIHRDIKSSNILLDERLHAKVADFGLSKAFGDGQSYVTTQVKGTLGYLDPEYYMTNQLTEKSDVYSFGVVMLELVTGRMPIQNGQYIVREVRTKMDTSRDLYNLHELLDPSMSEATISLVGFERFVDLALRCVDEAAAGRPRMGDVVKEIENIMELGGVNPNLDSAPVSSNYGTTSSGASPYLYSDKSLFEYSGSIPSGKVEPQ